MDTSADPNRPRPTVPVNLTAAAEPMSWVDASNIVGIREPSNQLGLEVHGLSDTENSEQNDGSRETVYVVIAGFGVLHSDYADVECTGGDVLFVPKGCRHRFEQLDGQIKIWRISPVEP